MRVENDEVRQFEARAIEHEVLSPTARNPDLG
jgi:hypothetical protein